jgi:hypothetical protein
LSIRTNISKFLKTIRTTSGAVPGNYFEELWQQNGVRVGHWNIFNSSEQQESRAIDLI